MAGRLKKAANFAADFVAALDPTDTLMKTRAKKASSAQSLTPKKMDYIPGDSDTSRMMERQNKIKKTFAKIPGK